ncbi:hypothetical protein OH799_31350 [Nocardia sp. NBC_00881]|uniref:hypothetical protein n=1 Tax=Nocardia sp. NBC_00881 TaxID=2975995 RepID=UPI00386EC196|nr:hypothetical protein OH799_31350 [Nocardia sp. NBC_00881]
MGRLSRGWGFLVSRVRFLVSLVSRFRVRRYLVNRLRRVVSWLRRRGRRRQVLR